MNKNDIYGWVSKMLDRIEREMRFHYRDLMKGNLYLSKKGRHNTSGPPYACYEDIIRQSLDWENKCGTITNEEKEELYKKYVTNVIREG